MNADYSVNWVPGITLEELEKNCILAAFKFYRGNKTTTASSLKIAIRTLEHKLERYEADAKAREDQRNAEAEDRRQWLERQRGPELTRRFSIGGGEQITQGDLSAGSEQRDAEVKRQRGDQITERFGVGNGSQLLSEAELKRRAEAKWRVDAVDAARARETEEKGGENAELPTSGVQVEPTSQTTTERALSMQKPKEVQKVLQGQASSGSARSARR